MYTIYDTFEQDCNCTYYTNITVHITPTELYILYHTTIHIIPIGLMYILYHRTIPIIPPIHIIPQDCTYYTNIQDCTYYTNRNLYILHHRTIHIIPQECTTGLYIHVLYQQDCGVYHRIEHIHHTWYHTNHSM